jgi:hypothetical protein
VGSEALSPAAVLTSPAFDLLGVRYVMLPPGAAPLVPQQALAYDGPDARVFVDARAVPRALVVFHARCADDATAPSLLRARALDVRQEVLLAGCTTPPAAGPPGAASVEIVAATPARVRVATVTQAPAWLVLGDTWYPGWRARVDGQDAALWRANHAFRAVHLPAGRHEVEMRFVPDSVRRGAALSALAGLAVLALALPWPRRERAP